MGPVNEQAPTLTVEHKRRIALIVHQLRQELGFSQAQLVDRAGVTLEALRNVESGNKAWPRTIERIARALGLTPMQLYERAAAIDRENVVPIRV